jgi:hypothetical protein
MDSRFGAEARVFAVPASGSGKCSFSQEKRQAGSRRRLANILAKTAQALERSHAISITDTIVLFFACKRKGSVPSGKKSQLRKFRAKPQRSQRKRGKEKREKRKEKGGRRKEKGERRKEKGERRREKGEKEER